MSLHNRLCADNERQRIIDADECKLAATQMKIDFKDKRSRKSLPKGCYFLIRNGLIYSNIHISGSKSDSAQQVCKGIGKKFDLMINSVSICFIVLAKYFS